MNLSDIKRVFFIGIGGIGMSALARYFNRIGKLVAGYDSTPTLLTAELSNEGITVHHEDNINSIPNGFLDNPNELLVIYTPAIPKDHKEFNFLLGKKYSVIKRAKALGMVANEYATAAISGTHGKTSTSTMLAYLLSKSPQRCDAFLGGISKNFNSNLVLGNKGANRLVVEADEFDRSFLSINPQLAIVTSVDADHLDIYDNHTKVKEAFEAFVSNITPGGVLIIKKGLEEIARQRKDITIYSYSGEDKADFYPENMNHKNGFYSFDLITPFGIFEKVSLGILGRYNVENAIAASAAALIWGISGEILLKGLHSFKGIVRRFDLRYKSKRVIYIDDYAHHPKELSAAIGSLKEIFPKRRITGIFQPHLYTRTRDFADEFAESLSQLDELIMLPIYPAREQPIAGVNAEMILNKVKCKVKQICSLDNLVDVLMEKNIDVLITLGAGNIDKVTGDIVNMLKVKEKK
jgi:UDP-N-acetylmuramate--alanine ligase